MSKPNSSSSAPRSSAGSQTTANAVESGAAGQFATATTNATVEQIQSNNQTALQAFQAQLDAVRAGSNISNTNYAVQGVAGFGASFHVNTPAAAAPASQQQGPPAYDAAADPGAPQNGGSESLDLT